MIVACGPRENARRGERRDQDGVLGQNGHVVPPAG